MECEIEIWFVQIELNETRIERARFDLQIFDQPIDSSISIAFLHPLLIRVTQPSRPHHSGPVQINGFRVRPPGLLKIIDFKHFFWHHLGRGPQNRFGLLTIFRCCQQSPRIWIMIVDDWACLYSAELAKSHPCHQGWGHGPDWLLTACYAKTFDL